MSLGGYLDRNETIITDRFYEREQETIEAQQRIYKTVIGNYPVIIRDGWENGKAGKKKDGGRR